MINSENGLLIESVELAGELADFIDYLTDPVNAYEVTVNRKNRLQWTSSDRTIEAQPARGGMQGFVDLLGGLLPIESQL